MASAHEMTSQTVTRPDPDPTVLTTQSLLREIASLKELFDAKFASLGKELLMLREVVNDLPHSREQQIHALESLMDQKLGIIDEKFSTVNEKFATVHTQFSERDVRVEQSAKDTKTAIDAALSAQEKAFQNQNQNFVQSIAKSETATVKSIDQQGMLIATTALATNSKIDDLKERVLRSEATMVTLASQRNDAQAMRVDQRAQGASIAQIVGVAAAIILGGLSLGVSILWHVGTK